MQSHAVPLLLRGYDVMASSATGSGKTIMFGLPLLQRAVALDMEGGGGGKPSALVIAPTREVGAEFNSWVIDDAFESLNLLS